VLKKRIQAPKPCKLIEDKSESYEETLAAEAASLIERHKKKGARKRLRS